MSIQKVRCMIERQPSVPEPQGLPIKWRKSAFLDGHGYVTVDIDAGCNVSLSFEVDIYPFPCEFLHRALQLVLVYHRAVWVLNIHVALPCMPHKLFLQSLAFKLERQDLSLIVSMSSSYNLPAQSDPDFQIDCLVLVSGIIGVVRSEGQARCRQGAC